MHFITFEGIEGSGKTTQVNLILGWLRNQTDKVLLTREPGGTAIGDHIREILLHPDNTDMTPEAEILLFSAARAQIVRQVLLPHLEQGWIVICDRFYDSTLAYQGYGHGLSLDALHQITDFATGGLTPDLTIFLDIGVEAGLRRKAQTPAEWNRMEAQSLTFHHQVYSGYQALAAQAPDRWFKIDAELPQDVIQTRIRRRIAKQVGVEIVLEV
ncbi:MAG: dTMP kinase [Chloroflexi bacterium]|nr:dTMP kinase [Chloroflexota bacterium]